jgi:hypothetical protein
MSIRNPVLTDFEIIRPKHERSQTQLAIWLAKAYAAAEAWVASDNEKSIEKGIM